MNLLLVLMVALATGCSAMDKKSVGGKSGLEERAPASREITIVCDSDEKDVRVEISEDGYDRDGRKFHGKIYKKNELIRETDLRRTAMSNSFGLNADGRGGWSFFFSDRHSAQITAESEAMRKLIGPAVIVTCDRQAPREWY